MAELQQQLIWLGAGTARQPNLNFNTFSQITLVEAREDACNALQQAYTQPNITVLQQLVSAEAASHNFTSYNLAEFSAISPIAGLKDLFPGLKTKSQERMQSKAVNELIDQINTNQPLQPEANTLIIDISDQAHSLLSKLIQTKQLALFNTLVIPYGTELYAGMADIAVITELLSKEHFVLQSIDNSDPDLPLYSFKLDATAKKVAQLNHKVKQLTEQLAAAQQSETNNRQQLEQQKAELTKQLEAAKQQASADQQQLEQQKAELSKQLDAAKQQAAADKQQLEQQKAELRKQLEAAKQKVSTEKQQLEQQKAELTKQLEAAKQQAATEKQQSEQQKAELGKQLEAAKQQAATEKQQSEQQKAELAKQVEAAKQQASTEKQQLEQQKAELTKQLEAARQQAATDQQQLEQQKAELGKQLEAAKQQAATEKQQSEQQKAELAKQVEAAKQQASTEKQQLEQQKAELTKQLEAARQQAATDQQQLEQQKAELGKQLEAAKQRAATEKQQSEQQKAELSKQLEAAKQQALTEKQQLEQQKSELTKQLEAARQQAATDQQQLEQQKAELGKQLEAAKQRAATEKQQSEQQKAELSKQLEAAKQQASTDKQQLEQQKAELSKQLEAAKQQASTDKQQLEHQKADLAKQLESMKQQASYDKQNYEQKQQELNKKLELSKQEATKRDTDFEELKQEHQSLAEKFAQLEKHSNARIGELKTELAEVKKQLEQAKKLESLEDLLDAKFAAFTSSKTEELNKAVGNIKNHINAKVDNSAKQLESYIGINNYLEKGIKPLSFHGWPISPDIGLYLTGLIDANNYDVIIEFGSGTSTVLMAKALVSKQRGLTQKLLGANGQQAANELMIAESDYQDLPARIVTFEHNSKYHAQTLKALLDNGVEQLVDLVHAPLVDYQYKDGSQFLYYSCTEKLTELAKVFNGRKANILILVDGPPGSTNKHARFPALPHLLNTLSGHNYTIVMDDYKRPEEKEIVDKWLKISVERFLVSLFEEIPSEKGLAILKIE